MTRMQQIVVGSWMSTIRAAIRMGDAEAACALTVAYVRRLREVGLRL